MAHVNSRWSFAAAALVAAALAGCHDDHNSSGPTPPAAPAAVVWSTFVEHVFSNGADTTPIPLDGLTFNFDVDDDPTAFDGLLM